jgi:hypothetical protein
MCMGPGALGAEALCLHEERLLSQVELEHSFDNYEYVEWRYHHAGV